MAKAPSLTISSSSIRLLGMALALLTISCGGPLTAPPGPAGPVGEDGADGQAGRDGTDGIDGRDGSDGLDYVETVAALADTLMAYADALIAVQCVKADHTAHSTGVKISSTQLLTAYQVFDGMTAGCEYHSLSALVGQNGSFTGVSRDVSIVTPANYQSSWSSLPAVPVEKNASVSMGDLVMNLSPHPESVLNVQYIPGTVTSVNANSVADALGHGAYWYDSFLIEVADQAGDVGSPLFNRAGDIIGVLVGAADEAGEGPFYVVLRIH